MTSNWVTEPLRGVVGYIAKGIPPAYVECESDTTIRVLNQKCNREYTINYTEARLHDLSKKKVPPEKYLRDDDVLINSTGTGTAGRVAQLLYVPCPTVVDGHMIVIRPNEKLIPRYLGYAIKAHQQEILKLDEGSTGQTELNRERLLSEIIVSYPVSHDEQRDIADTLSALDARIAENKKINHHLEQMVQAIFKSWFVDFEPFGGEVPFGWPTANLHTLSSMICRGITPKYSETSEQIIINQKCIRNHTIDLSFARLHIPKVVNEKWLQYGDLLINSTGEGTLGRTAPVWFKPKNLTVDSHVTIVRPAKDNLIFYVGLWGITHEQEIEALHTGSTGQTELPKDRVKNMALFLPDDDTLNNFNTVITPIAAALVANQEENARLAALRDTLLPRLMSGELSVAHIAAK